MLLFIYWNMVNLVPIIILHSLDYKIYHRFSHFVRIISVFCDLEFWVRQKFNKVHHLDRLCLTHIGFQIQNYFKSPMNKNGFHFILAVIKPFPFRFSCVSCFFQVKGNELRQSMNIQIELLNLIEIEMVRDNLTDDTVCPSNLSVIRVTSYSVERFSE